MTDEEIKAEAELKYPIFFVKEPFEPLPTVPVEGMLWHDVDINAELRDAYILGRQDRDREVADVSWEKACEYCESHVRLMGGEPCINWNDEPAAKSAYLSSLSSDSKKEGV